MVGSICPLPITSKSMMDGTSTEIGKKRDPSGNSIMVKPIPVKPRITPAKIQIKDKYTIEATS